MKCATVIIAHENDTGADNILDVKPHKSAKAARAYVFSEILRVMEDIYADETITVSQFNDNYGELCIKLSSSKDPNEDTYIIKTMFKEKGKA